jgi:hypothetical protein
MSRACIGQETQRLARGLALAAVTALSACLPENPPADTTSTVESDSETGVSDAPGLFACPSPPCTLVVVSQTLDDRVDVYDAGASALRGRINIDLKPDPSGAQTAGNLLDEPYGLLVADQRLRVLVGHYPDTDRGSLLTFPFAAFDELSPGATFEVSDYFTGGAFSGEVEQLALAREEPLFMLAHPSGRLLIAAFNNDLKTFDWSAPGLLLIIDPETGAIAQVDLGALDAPCRGAWSLVALNDDMTRVATACDGSNSVAILELPDLSALTPAAAADAVTGCGYTTPVGQPDIWTTRYLAPDGAGGLLLTQSSPTDPPRLTRLSGQCSITAPPGSGLPEGFEALRSLRDLVLLQPASAGTPYWLSAGGGGRSGVYVIRGSTTPSICGEVTGLEGQFTGGVEANEPFALALTRDHEGLAIGAGPTPENFPETREGRGQLLWAELDAQLDACEVSAASIVELSAGSFEPANPLTWSRAPNALHIVELEEGSS